VRLQELFLIETTEEDRAIISLSSSISDYLSSNYDNDEDDTPYDPDAEYDDELDITGDEDKPIKVGTIKQLFDTPLSILNPIKIELQSDYGIRQRRNKDEDAKIISRPGDDDILGLWYGDSKTMVLNKDYIGTLNFKSIISHELRHALDDFKSGFKANTSKRYSTPRNIEHQNPNQAELAEPAEINARFLQVLHNMVLVINNVFKRHTGDPKSYIMNQFDKMMKYHSISELFPEKEKSKQYKRLIKRGVDFIDKEIAYRQNLRSKTESF
jgi:hypothetical protein